MAATDASVLLLGGETGTGKARCWRARFMPPARGRTSPRSGEQWRVASRIGGKRVVRVPQGAFHGRLRRRARDLSSASGGTVFLDELGEMPKDVQVKLLRVLQEGEVRPVGSTRSVQVDVRIIAATNRSLNELRSTLLREDLYFRIATIVMEMPPLRTRPEDVLVLAQHFAGRLSRRYGREISLSRAALELLLGYSFSQCAGTGKPGESAGAVSADDPQIVTDKDLKPLLGAGVTSTAASTMNESFSMEQMERLTIQQALRVSAGNRTKAASLLGISRDTLYRKLRQYQV